MRGERCACRGYIEVEDGNDWDAVASAVLEHNRGDEHRDYIVKGPPPLRDQRRCKGLEDGECGRLIGPDVDVCHACATRAAVGRRLVAA